MTRKNKSKILVLALAACLWTAVAGSPLSAQSAPASEIRLSGPLGGAAGQTLRVAVAALPVGDDHLAVRVEIWDADATDLEPIAELRPTRVERGRSIHLDLDFEDATALKGRQEVVVRLEVIRSGGDPNQTGDFVASLQVLETTTGKNQLWGDWFIISD